MRNYLIYIFFSINSFCFSQEPIFSNIGTSNGIPSSETYNVFQDSKGYVWFGTEAGLCKFDGTNISVYDAKKGLSEKACYGICEHPNGKIWYITSKNRVLYYDYNADSLVEAGFSKLLKTEILKMPTSQIYSIQAFDDSTLWINAQWISAKINFYTNKISILPSRDSSSYHFDINKNSIFPVKFASERYLQNINGQYINLKFSEEDNGNSRIKWDNANPPQWRCLTAKNSQGQYFIAWDNYLIKIYGNRVIETYKTEASIISIYCGKDNSLWIGTSKMGAYCFINSSFSQLPLHVLNGLSVSGVLVDQENGLWCSTIEKGLFYSRNINLLSYSQIEGLNKRQELIRAVGSTLFCISSLQSIDVVSENRIKKVALKGKSDNVIRDIEPYKTGFLIVSYDGLAYTDTSFSRILYYSDIKKERKNAGIDVEITIAGRVFFVQNGALMELVNNKEILVRIPVLKSGANCMTSYGDKLYIGCKDGLYAVNTFNYQIDKILNVTGNISAICRTNTNQIVLVTKDEGIYFQKNDSFENITSELGLGGIRLFDIAEGKNGVLWIASNKGLVKINDKKSFIYNIYNGLPSNEIYKVECSNNDVFFNTNEGLFRFEQTVELKNETPPAIYLKHILVNERKINPNAGLLVFDYDKNNIRFEFDVLTFKNYGNVQLIAKIKGFADSLIIFYGNKIDFNNLKAGDYELTVSAQNSDGVRSHAPLVFTFRVLEPFWETSWFIIVCSLLGIIIIAAIVYLIIIRIRKKEEEKTKINKQLAEYHLTALQAQMNPHFIFNAINSIQTYILDNETQIAYDYLAKFAKLIRMVLSNAKERALPIEKEIELLKIYIELEQLRFENKFEFELLIDSEIDLSNVELPPMLIQPYIENAIWHGLMPLGKTKKGNLKLEIKKHSKGILIIIEDNGIGRKKSLEQKADSLHGSMGMELTESRIQVMNSISNGGSSQINIIDMMDVDGKPLGTRIEIIISKRVDL